MKTKTFADRLVFLLFLTLTFALLNVASYRANAQLKTTISVEPSTNVREKGQSFTLSILVSEVEFLHSWQAKIIYDTSKLYTNSTLITEGPFLKLGDPTYFPPPYFGPNYIQIGCLITKPTAVDGTGILAYITFIVTDTGKSIIAFDPAETRLQDPDGYPISYATIDGEFYTTHPKASFYYLPNPTPPALDYYPDPSLVHDPCASEKVTFNASKFILGQLYRGSYDPDGYISNYTWNFGDGNITTVTTPVISHAYAFAGVYDVGLTVTDTDGKSDFVTQYTMVISGGKYQYNTPNFTKSPTPSYFDTSEYMLGSVAVGIILPESIGGAYNWTDDEITITVEGIREATDWWKSQNPSAQLSFAFDVHARVPTIYEPIQMPEWEDYKWIENVMSYLNYTSGGAWERVTNYNNDIRKTSGTDWAFTIFVVDCDPSVNVGLFNGGGYAHAYLGGPWITMSRFSSWAWNSPNYHVAVPAHEMGHIFYATDEYNGVQENSGYLNATDKDGSFGIMNQNNLYVSAGTNLQIGWRDFDQDGILDIMDTYPAIKLSAYPTTIYEASHQFSGVVVEVPHQNFNPFGQRNNLSINEILSVKYSLDEGPWLSASPLDGAFDEALENYTFTLVFQTWGTHTLRIRAANSVGNSREWSFTLETAQPYPVASFTHAPSIPIVGEKITFDGSGSHDPNGAVVTYVWDFGEGSTGDGMIATHAYNSPGTYTVTLNVTDNEGLWNIVSKPITIASERKIIQEFTVDGRTFATCITSNSTVSNISFNRTFTSEGLPHQGIITFNVTGSTGTIGFCNVTIPKNFMWGDWVVLVDETLSPRIVTWDNANYYVYFTYTHSSHTVAIISTGVVPEFPFGIALFVILALATLVGAIIGGKRISKTRGHNSVYE